MPDTRQRLGRVNREAAVRLNRELFLQACAAKNAKTDEQRAELFGTSRRAILRYLKGDVDPKLTTARRYAHELGVTVDDLWTAA